jgi:hypothetical protein
MKDTREPSYSMSVFVGFNYILIIGLLPYTPKSPNWSPNFRFLSKNLYVL